jgi:hypothetical protein
MEPVMLEDWREWVSSLLVVLDGLFKFVVVDVEPCAGVGPGGEWVGDALSEHVHG